MFNFVLTHSAHFIFLQKWGKQNKSYTLIVYDFKINKLNSHIYIKWISSGCVYLSLFKLCKNTTKYVVVFLDYRVLYFNWNMTSIIIVVKWILVMRFRYLWNNRWKYIIIVNLLPVTILFLWTLSNHNNFN